MLRRFVGLAVAVGLVAGCASSTVDSTTTAPVAVAPVPAVPTGEAWRWTSPAPLHAVVRAGAGVVVADDDGVTALDGITGAARWRYARPGLGLTALQASPDGGSVVLVHSPTVTVLDALTGAPRWEDEADGDPVLTTTDAVVVLARASGS